MRGAAIALIALTACKGEVVDPYDPSHLTEVEVELSDADWDTLRFESRLFYELLLGPDCFSGPPAEVFTWQTSTVRVDGEELEEVGVRKKGFIGSLSTTRPSLKIDSDRFVVDQEFEDGTEHITLNNNNQDPSRVHTCLGYGVFADAGVPAPRCSHARVTVNGQDLGVYSNVQPIKRAFLRENFGTDEGDLYEGTVSDFNLDWLQTFEIKTEGSTLAPLQELATVLDEPDATLMAELGQVLDIDAFVSFWAVESLIGHWDGYATGRNNFYVYHDPTDGLLRFIPWGADAVLEDPESDAIMAYSEVTARLYNHPDGHALFLAESQRLLDDVWDEDTLHSRLDEMQELIEPHLLGPADQASSVADVRGFIDGRRSVVQAALDAPPDRPDSDRPLECVDPVGSVTATFDTVWGSTGAVNPFVYPGTLEGDAFGVPFHNDRVAGQAGIGDEGEPQIILLGIDPAGETLSAVVIGLRDDMEPGTYDIDIASVPGFAFTMDLTAAEPQPENVVLLGGTLTLDSFSDVTGQAVTGSIDAILFPNFFE